MKYLIVLSLLLTSCACPQRRIYFTLNECMDIVTNRLNSNILDDRVDSLAYETGIYVFCRDADNDPDLAMRLIERFQYSH